MTKRVSTETNRWTIWKCSECGWEQLSSPGGLPCISCLRYETFKSVEVVPVVAVLTPGDKAALVAFLENYGFPYFGEAYQAELIEKLS